MRNFINDLLLYTKDIDFSKINNVKDLITFVVKNNIKKFEDYSYDIAELARICYENNVLSQDVLDIFQEIIIKQKLSYNCAKIMQIPGFNVEKLLQTIIDTAEKDCDEGFVQALSTGLIVDKTKLISSITNYYTVIELFENNDNLDDLLLSSDDIKLLKDKYFELVNIQKEIDIKIIDKAIAELALK